MPAQDVIAQQHRHRPRSCQLIANFVVCAGSGVASARRPRLAAFAAKSEDGSIVTRSLTATTSAAVLKEGMVMTISRGMLAWANVAANGSPKRLPGTMSTRT